MQHNTGIIYKASMVLCLKWKVKSSASYERVSSAISWTGKGQKNRGFKKTVVVAQEYYFWRLKGRIFTHKNPDPPCAR